MNRVDPKSSQFIRMTVLGLLGQTTTEIALRVRLSSGQVLYRLRLAGVKRAEYRSGRSVVAVALLRMSLPGLLPVADQEAARRIAEIERNRQRRRRVPVAA